MHALMFSTQDSRKFSESIPLLPVSSSFPVFLVGNVAKPHRNCCGLLVEAEGHFGSCTRED